MLRALFYTVAAKHKYFVTLVSKKVSPALLRMSKPDGSLQSIHYCLGPRTHAVKEKPQEASKAEEHWKFKGSLEEA